MGIAGDDDQRIERALSQVGIANYTVRARANGQNNDVIAVRAAPEGLDLIFRFPRHPRAAGELAREVALLRVLRERAPLPVPDPIYVRLDPPTPGEVFMGYARLSGEPLTRDALAALPDASRRRIAGQLGAFLTALHSLPPEVFNPPLAVANDRATWERMYGDVRVRLFPLMRPDARQRVAAHFESSLDDAASQTWRPAPIHGDFGAGNILFDARTCDISGILDWSSAGLGDPATDLAALIAPASYGEGVIASLAPAYPPFAAELPRARFYVGTFALQEALFGVETGDATAFEAGIAGYR